MTREEFDNLKIGNLIQGKASGLVYIVIEKRLYSLLAVRTVDVSKPDEWNLVSPPNLEVRNLEAT